MNEKDKTIHLMVDPDRRERRGGQLTTGIYARAHDSDGKVIDADIYDLTKESLNEWLRSRGGDNPWAERVVETLLGHD